MRLTLRRVERELPGVPGEDRDAAGQDLFRSALGVKPLAPGSKLERRHQFQLRVEAVPMQTSPVAAVRVDVGPQRASCLQQRDLGRITRRVAVGLEPRVVASRRRLGERRQR